MGIVLGLFGVSNMAEAPASVSAVEQEVQRVQTFGKKKTATAVACCQSVSGKGKGMIKVNGVPLELLEPAELRVKAFESLLILGKDCFANLDIRIKVRGGGPVAKVYAVRQAIARCIIAYAQKYLDEQTKQEYRDYLIEAD